MASNFIFTSPGVKFRERSLDFVSRNIGVTTLGLVGESLKGPAFEKVFLQDSEQYLTRFGRQSIAKFGNGQLKYQAPYAANSYLSESSQMWFTRVLGLSGYDAGKGFALVLDAGVDISTTGATTTSSGTDTFSNNSYLGTALFLSGQTGSFFSGFTKTGGSFTGDLVEFTATTVNNDGTGSVNTLTTTISGSSYQAYENMVLGIVRSKASVEDVEDGAPVTSFEATALTMTSNNTNVGTGNMFGEFIITASKPTDPDDEPEAYTVSLDPNSRSYITNVLGIAPKDKKTKLYIESVYPDLIKKLDADGLGYGIKTQLIDLNSNAFTDYKQQYQTPVTPWVVSELRGSDISRLFKFISISDGNAANREIKVSIQNINPISKEFDIVVRDFNDTDENITVLESFTRCSMRKGENNYIGRRIGTLDGQNSLQSEYIIVEIDDEAPQDAFPAGFEGYDFKDYAASATSTTSGLDGVQPKIFYKKSYNNNETLSRVYLGVSENGYDGISLQGTGINQNFFNYNGDDSAILKTKGFHMDSGATATYSQGNTLIGQFETGAGKFRTSSDVNSDSDTYGNSNSRKFTLVPAGGFDGWDEHRTERTYGDLYRKGGIYDGVDEGITPSNDFQAWETAIRTFENPEEVTINIFATPGINWSDQNILVKNTIRMIEEDRTDSLYVIDSPDVNVTQVIGETKADVVAANDVVSLLQTADINTSYGATYFPHIQIRDDQNNLNIYLPPTGEVLKSIAFTDNTKFPWFSPAGLQRGIINALRSKYKMSNEARGILYGADNGQIGRINPIADFVDTGTVIFGQKTLLIASNPTNRINVRRLLLQAKILISNVANRLLFEQNDQIVIDEFLSKVNPILDQIKTERGLTSFEVVMDDSLNTAETRNRKELFGKIRLVPTNAVEFIGIEFVVTPEGASFNEA